MYIATCVSVIALAKNNLLYMYIVQHMYMYMYL